MLYTLLKRLFKEHAGVHFWVPIVVVLAISFLLDLVLPSWQLHQLPSWALADHSWYQRIVIWLNDHGREIVGIYLAFAWVVWLSIKKASDVRWTMIGDLSDTLEGADRYFAIGTIPLREWFEPNALLYLATIIQHQQTNGPAKPLRHERVLLFYKDADFKALQASYLDQHYARSFSAIHDRFNVPLAYLRPKELRDILKDLKAVARRILAPYRWYAWKGTFWNSRVLQGIAKDTSKLRPFALVESGAEKIVLAFAKDGNGLAVERVTDKLEEGACLELVSLIEQAIYRPSSKEIWEHAKFGKYLCP